MEYLRRPSHSLFESGQGRMKYLSRVKPQAAGVLALLMAVYLDGKRTKARRA